MSRIEELQQWQRIALASEWILKNPVLGPGEIGVEADTERFKIGDGVKHWSEIAEYFVPDAAVLIMIQEYLDGLPSGEVTQQDLTNHVESSTPHPVYDDGPSLTLLYQNAKV